MANSLHWQGQQHRIGTVYRVAEGNSLMVFHDARANVEADEAVSPSSAANNANAG